MSSLEPSVVNISSVSSVPKVEPGPSPELRDFCKEVDGQPGEFETGADRVNRVSVREAHVRTVEVIKSAYPNGTPVSNIPQLSVPEG